MTGPRPHMQAAAFVEAELGRVSPDLQNDGPEDRGRERRFGNPERIGDSAGAAEEAAANIQPIGLQPAAIGDARLRTRHSLADPKNGRDSVCTPDRLAKGGQRQHETHGRPGVAGFSGADFGEPGKRQPALKDIIKRGDAKRENLAGDSFIHGAGRTKAFRRALPGSLQKTWHIFVFQPRNGLAQRKKTLARHGRLRHDVTPIQVVPVMFL